MLVKDGLWFSHIREVKVNVHLSLGKVKFKVFFLKETLELINGFTLFTTAKLGSLNFFVIEAVSRFPAPGLLSLLNRQRSEFGIEVTLTDVWAPRWSQLLCLDFPPIDAPEELVALDLLPALRSVIGILLQKPSDEVLSNITHIDRDLNFLMLNALSNLCLVMRVERREPANHLVQKAA